MKTCIKMSQSEGTVEFIKKMEKKRRKRRARSGKSTHVTKHRTCPKVFVPSSTITKPISSISSTITRDTYNKNIENSNNGQGFVSDVENRVTTETNVDLTNEYKDKGITSKCIFFVQQWQRKLQRVCQI